MGNWNINIQGVGNHHNPDNGTDANRMAKRFVEDLGHAGHWVQIATFTHGGAESLLSPLDKPRPPILPSSTTPSGPRALGHSIRVGDIVIHRSPGSSPYCTVGKVREMSGDGYLGLLGMFRVWGPGIPHQSTRVTAIEGGEQEVERVPASECLFMVESGESV
jgi:hypothetical protein